jgi:hypothetical protein
MVPLATVQILIRWRFDTDADPEHGVERSHRIEPAVETEDVFVQIVPALADGRRAAGSMDAIEYKHVVLGLIFLKYVSGAFEEQHAKLDAEHAQGADPEDRDESYGRGWSRGGQFWKDFHGHFVSLSLGVATVLTVYSFAVYLYRYRQLLR